MRILILGDSVAFPRPLRGQPLTTTWPHLLRQILPMADIWQRARPRSCLADVRAELQFFTESLPEFDVVVIQAGIVDAPARPYPRWVYRLIEIVFSYDRMRAIERFAHRWLVWIYGRPWTAPAEFGRTAEAMMRKIWEGNRAVSVIWIPVAPVNQALAEKMPGIAGAVARQAAILTAVLSDLGKTGLCQQVDPFSSLPPGEITIDDGHHLSRAGHAAVAAAVARALGGRIPHSGVEPAKF